jgi:hydroxymethylbilane synthase
VGRHLRLLIGSRKSDLARLQAYEVGEALKHYSPDLDIQYQFRESLGDKNLKDPLWQMPERGVFTEDFRQNLLSGEVDLVVHSWKDLPIEVRSGTRIVATLKRADARDVLLFKKSTVEKLSSKATSESIGQVRSQLVNEHLLRIYSSSPRRAYNGLAFLNQTLPFKFKFIGFESVRGNIPTRLKKYMNDPVDGIIVAKAALDRLLESKNPEFAESQSIIREAISKSLFMIFPLCSSPAAAAQGALAVEVVPGRNQKLDSLLAHINVAADFECVEKEREILAQYGGGCHQKIGVTYLKRQYGEISFVRGKSDSGEEFCIKKLASENHFPKTNLDKIWSAKNLNGDEEFEREFLNIEKPLSANSFWVSKSVAWPKDWHALATDFVWASGVETWQKLSALGIWVSGCSESLGEQERPMTDHLQVENKAWFKLTHVNGFESQQIKNLPTYRLVSKCNNAEYSSIKGKTHFYWSSGSLFEAVLKNNPEILKNGFHGCGPGNTYLILKKYFESNLERLLIFLDENDFREKVVLK